MAKALDLTNQKFGKLTALKRAPKRTDKYTRWVCLCECGNITEIRTDYLRNGHTTSCGCNAGRIDHTNERFGRLVAIQHLSGGKYLCKCDCGNIVEVETTNLTSGNTQSCGCLQKDRTSEALLKSLIGQRFGKLVVIEKADNNKFGHVCWKCQCDCGGITIVDATNLRNGNTSSCGCIKSKGEMIINNWLQKHHIDFQPQYSVSEIVLESGRHPFFDFGIFKNNKLICLLEYNGKQHYSYSNIGWDTKENFEKTVDRDKQKEKQCKQLGIPLYIIKYNEDIEKKLSNIFIEETEELNDSEC